MQTYEQLRGGSGRGVFYRAPRYAAPELFSPTLLQVRVDGRDVQMEDLSITGMAVTERGPNADWQDQVERIVPIKIRLGNHDAYDCEGEVRRVEPAFGGQRVGIRFTNQYLDIARLVRQHEEVVLRRDLDEEFDADVSLVPQEYRALCSDVLNLLRRHQKVLRRFKERANGRAPIPSESIEEVYAASEERLLRDWRKLWQAAEAIVRPLRDDKDRLRALKRYTENVLTPELMAGAIWKRSYEKPLGYPGDFGVMKQVYAWSREGADLYSQLVHRLGLEVGEFVAARMVMVQQTIARVIAERGPNAETRITSLGCGPAKEVENVLHATRLDGRTHFTLIDQDHDALNYTYERLLPNIARLAGQVDVRCLHVSFTQLLKASPIQEVLPPQDLIYTVGLVDYLAERRAQRLIEALYAQLAPGGMLLVGNVADCECSTFWPLEVIADWSLNYRNRADMLRLAVDCPGAKLEARADRTGRVWMLYVQKPATAA